MMLRVALSCSFFLPLSLYAAPDPKPYDSVREIEDRIFEVRSEVSELRSSLEGLDSLHSRLQSELRQFEDSFRMELRRLIVPLMSWPDRFFTLKATGWIELERMNLVLKDIKQELLKEPLRLIANREVRIAQVENLRMEIEGRVSELESKEELLDLQLEEFKDLQARTKRRVPQASGNTKTMPGQPALE